MRNSLRFCFVMLLSLSCIYLYADIGDHNGVIHGNIVTEDGSPAASIIISIDNNKHIVLTDANGNYVFKNVEKGRHTLTISLKGYEKIEKEISVNDSEKVVINFKLSMTSKELTEVIVKTYGRTGNDTLSEYVAKMPLKYVENPQVYSSIDKTVLQNQMLYSVDDAYRNIAGLQKGASPNYASGDGGSLITLRGFGSFNSLRNGLVAPVSTVIDAVNIERIEVLKGPSATLFGSNITSYGGAVNRVTKKPFDTFGGNVSLTGGSYNYYRAQTDVNTPVTNDKKLLFRINAAYTNTGTFQKTNARNQYTAVDPSLSYKPNDKLEINLDYEYYYTKAVPSPYFYYLDPTLGSSMKDVEKLGLDYKNSYIGSGLYTTSKVSNFFGQVNYKFNDHIRSSTNINTAYSYADGYDPYFYITLMSDETSYGVSRAVQSETNNSNTKYFQLQQNFNFDFNIGTVRNRTVLGFDYLRTRIYQTNISIDPFDSVPFRNGNYASMNAESVTAAYNALRNDPDNDFEVNNTWIRRELLHTYSGYIADVLTPVKGLNILLSIRYENNSEKNGQLGTDMVKPYKQSAWSPKFGAIYEIVKDKLSVFGNYQNSFKSNGYFVKDTFLTTVLSKPETANQWEGGFKTSLLKGRILATLSYYDINVKNTLIYKDYFNGNTIQSQIGKERSKGIEMEVNAYLVKGFSLVAGAAYNDSKYVQADEDLQGLRPVVSSPWLVNFNASYQFLAGTLKGLGFGFGGNYADRNNIVNSKSQGVFYLPSYFVLNANAFYDFKKFRFGIRADNLTNEHYWQDSYVANPQPLLSIMGSVTYKF